LPHSILHYLADTELDRGGIVRSVLDLTGALAARGHRVGLATCSPVDIPEAWSGPSAPVVITLEKAVGGVRFRSRSVADLRRALTGYDVVHFNNLWNPELRHFAQLAREAAIPYVVTPHGTLDPWSMGQRALKKRAYLTAGGEKLLSGAAALHFTAAAEQRAAERLVKPRASAVIPYVLDLAPFLAGSPAGGATPVGGAPGAPPTVLFLSRLHVKKRPELLIEAVAALRGDGIATRLVVAGPGEATYVASLRDLVARLDLAGVVDFVGPVGGQDKIDLYRCADLFVVPTSQENFGIVFVEALASGLPAVATTGTDIWQELAATGGAEICDLENEPAPVAALATVMAELLGDPARRQAMGEAGRRGVQDWLDVDQTCRAFAAFYSAAIDHYGN
jgi:glycosyltransferase involved in cell wall biosynthesis